MIAGNFFNSLYIDSMYCYSFEDFKRCLQKMFPQKDKEKEIAHLTYWLEPLILDGILKSWLALQNNDEADALIQELDSAKAESRNTQSMIHRILMALDIE